MELSPSLQSLQQELVEMAASDAIDVFRKALKGQIENKIQFAAASELMRLLPPMRPQESGTVVVHFGSVPRPAEIAAPVLSITDAKPQLELEKEAGPETIIEPIVVRGTD